MKVVQIKKAEHNLLSKISRNRSIIKYHSMNFDETSRKLLEKHVDKDVRQDKIKIQNKLLFSLDYLNHLLYLFSFVPKFTKLDF